jgi:predicted ester cyclase
MNYLKTHLLISVFVLVSFGMLVSCNDPVDSQEQKNKEIVKKTFEVVGNGDYEQMDNYIAADYVRHCQATPDLVIESLDAFKDFIRMDRESIPDQSLELKMLVAEGDLVAFWATYYGTQTGVMGPFPASGKKANLDFSGIHRMENGKIAETWVTWDNIAILTQLGHFPPKMEE